MQRGNYREAHQHCLNILKLDSSHADAWFLCGVIAGKNGQTAKAVEIFRNAIKLAPEQAEYRAELGKQLLALRQPEQALVMAQRGPVPGPLGRAHTEYSRHDFQPPGRT